VCVGIPFRERPDLLEATIAVLRASTPAVSTVVLADGPDAQARQALGRAACDRIMLWDRSCGDATCFNRLVSENDAEVYVLLENGARVSPGWLERMLRALAAEPAHGLCGPSTNRSWNEQQVFPDWPGDEPALSRAAREAAGRFGDAYASLGPLHSLADFCYVVTRAAVDRVGAADEGYGEGPCWEMDYNIRAERAGFRGIWAKAAFVWRAPVTPRRDALEARRFAFSKRRYQEHFCALHLRRETVRYEAHCRGEACEHFAPPDLITIRRDFTPAEPVPAFVASSGPATWTAPPVREVGPDPPLVSCIMPTANRRAYVPQAVAAFLRQDYGPRELVILDDGADPVEDLVPSDERIVYVRAPCGRTLGAKRNEACRLAKGQVIVHWDDDDWHAPWRVSYQVGRLLATGADMCGLERLWFYDPGQRRAWQYRYPGGRSRWLAGGTFCYRRAVWERHHFGDVTVGEDTRFVREATFARLLPLDRDDFYVARVHAANTCRKHTGGSSWSPVAREVVERMIERCGADAPGAAADSPPPAPLVSCIMPTYERSSFAALAIQRFAEQSYVNKELVIVDDGGDTVEGLAAHTPGVRYLRVGRRSIGEKRNAGCAVARGEIVVHWDDDDWYGRDRLRRQVEPILAGRADITGLRCRWLMTLPDGGFWQVLPELHRRMFVADVHGGTLMYRKRLWDRGARYPATSLAEDADMLRTALRRGARLQVLDDEGDFVYSRHGANAWRFAAGQFIDPRQWQPATRPTHLDAATVEQYRAAFRALPPPAASERRAGVR
jgi:glycosyltransferase involved in cell wall biosynthesis